MPSKNPTIRDLAAATGFSTATVSLALRHHPSVAPATRRAVLGAAQKTGYRSNALINALMAQVRTRRRIRPTGEVVTYLTAFPTETDWKKMPSFVAQYEGARLRAQEMGFDLQLMWLGDRGKLSRQVARVLHARGIRGSILAPMPVDHHTLALNWNEHTVAAIGYSFRQVALNRAAHHNLNTMLACYRSLRSFGYRRIGLAIHRFDDERVHHNWIAGYLGGRHVHGGEAVPPLLMEDYHAPAPFHRWFDEHRPDAVIAIWGHLTYDWLKGRGIRIPEDVGYASLDLGDRVGEIAGMMQDHHGVGMAAMDLLAGQLFRNEIGLPQKPKMMLIETMWIDGPTVARREAAPPSAARS